MLETLIALVIAATFLACNYASNARVWALVKASLESNCINRTINGRAEQLRSATFAQLTDATYIRDTIFATAPDAAGDAGGLFETIDVIAYPMPSPSVQSLQVTRSNTTGTATAVGTGDGTMPAQQGVRVNIKANWTAKGGQAHTRQISMFFAPGGISGQH
ncbi:MAG: hypothetical protein ABIP85_05435 [Chthoniobacteraceae bacterium]